MPTQSPSDHFDGRKYFNLNGANGRPLRDLPKFFGTPKARWPEKVPVTPREIPRRGDATFTATWVGHSTMVLQTSRGNVLTDPVWSNRVSPVSFAGPRRVAAPGVRFEDVPAIDLLLLSHNHYDHCDLPTLRKVIGRWNPHCVTLPGNGRWLERCGSRRVEELDWWERSGYDRLAITVTPAQHFSGRTPFDRNRALWGSFVIDSGDAKIYFGGDSGYGAHFQAIGERFGGFDLAWLPIGAYEPRWFMRDIHMNPADAVMAHRDLRARVSLAMHFGTFQLTPEAIDAPTITLAEELERAGVAADAFRALDYGATVVVPSRGA